MGPFAQAIHAREQIEGQLAPVTKDLDSYDLGAVARLLLLQEGYETVCKAVIEAFFIPTIGKTNYTGDVKLIYTGFEDAVSRGEFADSRGFLKRVLARLRRLTVKLNDCADSIMPPKRPETVEALEALSKNEAVRSEIINLLTQIMIDQGNFQAVEGLEDPQAMADRLSDAFDALKPKSVKNIIVEWVADILEDLRYHEGNDRDQVLIKVLRRVVVNHSQSSKQE